MLYICSGKKKIFMHYFKGYKNNIGLVYKNINYDKENVIQI